MEKIIWVDLDEVLAELMDYLLEHYDYKLWWKKIKRDDILDYYVHKIVEYDLTIEQGISWFRQWLFSDQDNLNIKPVIWAIDKLTEHKNNWYIFKIITARNEDLFLEYTKKWVNKHFPNIFDDIIFCNHFSKHEKTKSEICKENWIFHMVEDNYEYALELAENWIITYLIEKPWNKNRIKNHKNIIKVKSWDEINF